jgi:folate-binding protein YgfZ
MKNNFNTCWDQHRTVVRVSGEDRIAFAQGLFTQDMEMLSQETPLYSCFLTPQGKYVIDFFVFDKGDGSAFYLDCPQSRVDDFLKRVKIYKLRSDVSFEIDEDLALYVSEDDHLEGADYAFKDPRHAALGYRFVGSKDLADKAGYKDYLKHCLRHGVPQAEIDLIPEKTTLLEANLDKLHAVSFDKGCFLGQELTARMHYRALLKRKLYAVECGEGSIGTGDKVLADGKEIGEIRSVVDEIALAHLKIDAVKRIADIRNETGAVIKIIE